MPLKDKNIRDVRYYEAIDRLEKLHTPDEVFCHRKFYPEFTHQKQIKTFEARAEGQRADVESPKQEHGVVRIRCRRPNSRVENL